MTRETKLGLVIGGVFILCFALILSNTENEAAVDRQIAALLSSTLGDPDVAEQAGGGQVPQHPVAYSRPRVEPPQLIETRSPQPGANPAQAALLGTSAVAEADSLFNQEAIRPANSTLDAELRQSPPTTDPSPHSTVTDAIANRPLPDSHEDGSVVSHNGPDAKDDNPAVRAPTVPLAQSARAILRRPDNPKPLPRRVQIYVVAKNDNLTKIARKFCGKSTKGKAIKEYVDLIFQANRDILEDKNSLQVSQKLQIPIQDDTSHSNAIAEAVSAMSNPKRTTSSSRRNSGRDSTASAAWRWYQIKPNDRYSKIAREQLGDEKRWKEIFELNKNIFSDADVIRPGVLIKLPK